MKKIVFATANPNKIKEIKALLGDLYNFYSLEDIGCTEEVPEEQDTIVGNALQKAEYVKEHYKEDCFSEDTGLEITALNGAPGVYSARYAGPQRSASDNMDKVLAELEGVEDRSAQFKTVIALILDGKTYTFEGIVKGHIATERMGEKGFGYDPIFVPEGYDCSFAQMSQEEKGAISHRGRAIEQLRAFLTSL